MANLLYFCYYHDFSGFAIFQDELTAYKYAVDKGMQVAEIKEGDIKEQL